MACFRTPLLPASSSPSRWALAATWSSYLPHFDQNAPRLKALPTRPVECNTLSKQPRTVPKRVLAQLPAILWMYLVHPYVCSHMCLLKILPIGQGHLLHAASLSTLLRVVSSSALKLFRMQLIWYISHITWHSSYPDSSTSCIASFLRLRTRSIHFHVLQMPRIKKTLSKSLFYE